MDVRSDVRTIPLAVDLDGTLIAADLLWEGLFLLLRKQPLLLMMVPIWLLQGPARLKQEIAARVSIEPALLPYRACVVERLKDERAAGRQIILATGTPRKFAEAIAAHLGVFDDVMATDGLHNLTSERKRTVLCEAFGDGGFDYIGNSRHDLKVFDAARATIVVAPDRQAARWGATHHAELVATPKPTLRTVLKMLRVHQWIKNALVAVPMVLSHEYANLSVLLACLLAFMSFSAAASAVYIVNDIFDLAVDRKHATKRDRPFASGLLSLKFGLVSVVVLLVVSVAFALMLPALFLVVLGVYLTASTAYSLSIKRMLLLDVLMLAALYTLRMLAGAAATGMTISFWLIAFSIFFFLSLALVKRYVELRTTRLDPKQHLAGRSYRPEDGDIIAQAGMASAFSSALVLALYMDSAAVREQYAHPFLIWPLAPIVLYLTMRIWILARRDEVHDDPVVFIVRDWRSQLVAAVGGLLIIGAAITP